MALLHRSGADFGAAVGALGWLLEHGFLGEHASAAILGLTTEHDTLWLVVTVGDLPPIPSTDPLAVPLASDLPLCRAARLGESESMPTAERIRLRSPWLATFAPAAQAAAAVPVRAGNRTIGALGVTYSHPSTGQDSHLLTHLNDMGEHLGRLLRRTT